MKLETECSIADNLIFRAFFDLCVSYAVNAHNSRLGYSTFRLIYMSDSFIAVTILKYSDVPYFVCRNNCPVCFQGLRPSQIGVILRDSHGVAQVRRVTGNKIVRILKSKVIFSYRSNFQIDSNSTSQFCLNCLRNYRYCHVSANE